jgi:hypothetical protein
LHLSPTDQLRLKPGQSRHIIVNLDAQGSDFAWLKVTWEGQKPSQCAQIRIYRPKTTA